MFFCRYALIMLGFMLAAAPLQAEPAAFARVGKATSQPEYHGGKFKAFGWGTSTAFCGLRNANIEGAPFVGRDASWWLTYDRQALYLVCFIRLAPQGEHFLAATTVDNDPAIFDDDHLLVQVALDPRIGQAGVPFLRLAVNPNGAVLAETVEALPGQNHPADTDRIEYGNHVGPGHIHGHWWYARLRVPLDILNVATLDGVTARMHLAWVTQPLHLSWGGVQPDDWDRMPTVRFDPRPRASLRLNGSYPALFHPQGSVHLDLQSRMLTGTPDAPVAFRFSLSNLADGKTTWEKTWEETRESGQGVRISARERTATIAGTENRLIVRAETSLEEDTQLLFRNELLYRPQDDRVDAALAEWTRLHAFEPEANAVFDYVYAPYTHKLEARVNAELNVDVYSDKNRAKAERIATADRLTAAVVDAAGDTVARGEGPVSDGRGRALVHFDPPLPDGDYTLRLTLRKGDETADTAEMTLVRRTFEWEHTTLGKERVIIPPWTEVERGSDPSSVIHDPSGNRPPTADRRVPSDTLAKDGSPVFLTCWGRSYALHDTGLPSAMVSQGEDVLAAGGMRLEGIVNGQTAVAGGEEPPRITLLPGRKFPAEFARYELASNACPVAGEDFELEPAAGYAAEIEAASRLGAIRVHVRGRLDYDGLYTVALTLDTASPVTVDRLTLVIPLNDAADLYRFIRALDLHCLGAIPQGNGVLDRSSNLPPHPALSGHFVPVVFAGDYDHGLFWLSESDRGWSIDDEDDHALLVRENGQLQLKLNLFANPAVLDGPRTIEFAVMATPTRPKAVGYRQAFFAGKHTHDTAGFRFYGGGVNGFQLYTEEDYEGLRRFLYEDEDGIRSHYYDEADKPEGHTTYYRVRSDAAKQGHPLTLYGCTWGANAGMREFPTFGSAWTHTARTLETHMPHTEFMNWTCFGGTRKWDTRAELTPVYTLMDDSFVDAWLWHMVRIAKYSGVNGCFFDCFESLPKGLRGRVKTDINGVAYRRASDGRIRPFANPLRYHRRTRRFATALWLAGRPPALLQSNNFDNNYGPTWYIEGDMYLSKLGDDFIDKGITPEVYAAYTASCSGMAKASSHVATAPGPDGRPVFDDAIFSVLLAYGILHDIAHGGNPGWLSENSTTVNRTLREELDIGDPAVRHIRYWNPQGALAVSDARVLAGGYVNPGRKTALIAVLNPTEEPIPVVLRIGATLLDADPSTAVDILEGKPELTDGSASLSLPPHGVTFLLVKDSRDA